MSDTYICQANGDQAAGKTLRHATDEKRQLARAKKRARRALALLDESLRAAERLLKQNEALRARLDLQDRKIAHGCTDAFCAECDGEGE